MKNFLIVQSKATITDSQACRPTSRARDPNAHQTIACRPSVLDALFL